MKPRNRWPYANEYPGCKVYRGRDGVERIYFRATNKRLLGRPHSAEFNTAYAQEAKAAGKHEIGKDRFAAGTISRTIADWLVSADWKLSQAEGGIADGTKKKWRGAIERFRRAAGHHKLKSFGQIDLDAYLDERAKAGKHAARNDLKMLRVFFKWAKHDVATGLQRQADSKPHDAYEPEQMAQYRARHPLGTPARLAFELGAHTGQRNSDIAAFGPHCVKGGWITVKTRKEITGIDGQMKSGQEVDIPLHPDLRAAIDAMELVGLDTFLRTQKGKKFSQTALSARFATWIKEAGLPAGLHLHGLRHTAGAQMAEAGCNVQQICSILGCSEQIAMHYCKQANRKKLASEGAALWWASQSQPAGDEQQESGE